jgi:parallel beta-helix repeat protein
MIRIVRNEEANCINFEGSSVPAYFNACLSATAVGDYINIKNDIRSALAGEEFFEFSNIHYSEFEDRDGNTFSSAIDTADYITLNGNVAAPNDVNVGYLGSYDASNNTPDITTDLSGFINGDWYFVTVSGTQVLSGISYDLNVNDQVKFTHSSQTWSVITDPNARLADIENSALAQYDLYVDANYTGTTRTGSNVHPFNNLTDAIAASSEGDSISIKGTITVINSSTDAYTLPHGLFFYGNENAVIKYASYNSTNGALFYFNGTDYTQEFRFDNIDIENAGGYGVYIKKPSKVVVKDCEFKYNGWNGTQLNTLVSSVASGVLGYDSTQIELQSFYSSGNASNGGAIRIEECVQVEITSNSVSNNLRGIRLQDCGINGYGFISRNNTFNNIESGIYLGSSSYDTSGGCENFAVYNNASKFNSNNGILVIGGTNNVIALNHVEGNWNGGIMPWHVSNTIIRDDYLLNNNRSEFNGIGNTGDAGASLEIAGGTLRTTAKFILHAINNQIVDTGLGNATTSKGILLSSSLDNIDDRLRSIILLDNNTMQGQDYALVKSCDLDEVRLIKGDNTYIDSAIQDTLTTGDGDYYELPYSNQHTDAKQLDFCLDATGTQIGIKDSDYKIINYFSINQLKALEFLGNIRIKLKDSNKIQFDDVPPTGVSIDGITLTGTVQDKVNEINSLLQGTGTPSGNVPVITSSLSIPLTQGDTINYELTADFGVGYEWDLSNVLGVTTVEGNPRKIIGGSSLGVGTYNIPVKAINYNGEDSETIVLTVSTPPFANTKSVKFDNQDYLGANAGLLASILGRTGNGSGSSDAWSVSLWFKPSTNSQGQTIFYFGDNDANNGGYIQLMQLNDSGNKALRLRYGSNNNCLRMQTNYGSLTSSVWHHILVTYDGGTTGAGSSSLNSYYNRFKIYIDGSLPTRNNSHVNYGYTGSVDADNLRVGRFTSGNYMRGCRVDELAIFNSDQSANVSDIYNSGSPFDLSTLTAQPKHWWRMGDGDTFPYLQDNGTESNCIFQMYNMTAADIVSDTP